MSDLVISVENLGKKYVLGTGQSGERYTALRDVLTRKATLPFRIAREQWRRKKMEATPASGLPGFVVQSSRASPPSSEFWALKDVSFSVQRGEVVGIIGRNGAGKSTLLKILSRITEPTTGTIKLRGRVASLLEVGTGFHPELTGRENIFLNGAILGMHRAEIKAKFDEIVAFAEVERFLDTPVKRYSSGMYVRLAFSVAAHMDPEILIVDEVLAVGDAEFQKKCLGKMQSVAAGEGRTVLFVSHNISALRNLCSRALVLRRGQLVREGDVTTCIQIYNSEASEIESESWVRPAAGAARRALTLEKIRVNLTGQQPAHALDVDVDLRSHCEHKTAFLAVDVLDASGVAIMQALPDSKDFIACTPGDHQLRAVIALPPLIPGRYFVTVWVGSHNTETLDEVRAVVTFEVDASPVIDRSFPHTSDHGYIVPLSTLEHRRGPSADQAVAAPLTAVSL